MPKQLFILFLCLFVFIKGNGQHTINGKVIDSLSGKPLAGATVFFDQTSIWATTDKNGHFELFIREKTLSPLVIYHTEYRKKLLHNLFSKKQLTAKLVKHNRHIDPAFIKMEKQYQNELKWSKKIEKGHLTSRQLFLRSFKYLMTDKGRKYPLKILDEEVIRIKHSSFDTITYLGKKPIIFINEDLQYRITYILDEAVLCNKETEPGITVFDKFSASGHFFFKDLLNPDKKNRRFHRRREKAYKGSILHFMRSLAENKLERENFSTYFFVKNHEPEKVPVLFEHNTKNYYTSITPPAIFLVDYKKQHTAFRARQNFDIDKIGYFSPWQSIELEGAMKKTGVFPALPINYQIK